MRFILTLLLLLCTTFVRPVGAQDALTPEGVVEKLVMAPHGLTWASGPEIADLVNRVRQQPDLYIPHLLEHLHIDALAQSDDLSTVLKAQNAAMVLVTAGGVRGREALVDKLKDFYSSSDQLQLQVEIQVRDSGSQGLPTPDAKKDLIMQEQRLSRLITVERTIVNAFADAKDPRLKELLLDRLDREDFSTQLTSIQYFHQASKGDSKVKQRFEMMLKNPHSGFYESQLLKQY